MVIEAPTNEKEEHKEDEVGGGSGGGGSVGDTGGGSGGGVGACQFLIHPGRQVSEGACYCYLLGGGA
ncbi:hypothetical protein E2C01_098423 [Portunus trituberculatus]|uniref:Uncharacterized protein n=1 Tax=Portunus trituberculatus TaxID=210409 RepID=A0A5B7KC19_PORTR|nr:hypothetical protein [Portunus trituberculatus]